MAFSSKTHIADGVQIDYNVPFDYLDQDHIRVAVNKIYTFEVGSLYTFEWINDDTIRVRTIIDSLPVPAAAEVRVERRTPINTPAVIFGAGASLTSANLNKNSEYLTFALQEATDTNEEFTKLYLGSSATPPVTDNDGDALLSGAVYFDTNEQALFYWDGAEWVRADQAEQATIAQQAAENAQAIAEAQADIAAIAQQNSSADAAAAEAAKLAAQAAQAAAVIAQGAAEAAEAASDVSAGSASGNAAAAEAARIAAEAAQAAAELAAQTAGKSAYEVAVQNGFVGTEVQWLASLQGADGADGAQGPVGPSGPAGSDGVDGVDGVGVPAGGTAGQVLEKIDGSDYNTRWADASGGSQDLAGLTDVDLTVAPTDGAPLVFDQATGNWIAQPEAENGIAFLLDVTDDPNGTTLTPEVGPAVTNFDVFISGGEMLFGSDYFEIPVSTLQLGSKDFVITLDAVENYNTTGQEGLIGVYKASTNERSWLLRHNGNQLEFFGSTDGVVATNLLSTTFSANTPYDLVVRRSGTTITLEVNGVVVDTAVVASNYTFYNAAGPVQVGTYDPGSRDFSGKMNLVQIKFPSDALTGAEAIRYSLIGVPVPVFTAIPPTGMLLAQGQLLSRSLYPELFSRWGETFGAGDGSTTFGTPDLRGVVIRGLDAGRGLDEDAARVLGSYQEDAIKEHVHWSADSQVGSGNGEGAQKGTNGLYNGGSRNSGVYDPFLLAWVGAAETRMKNVAANFAYFYGMNA